MASARDDWWIVSGAAAALHGASGIEVRDVDVLVSVADARRIFPGLGLEPRPGAENDLFRSEVFGCWHGAPLAIEFMAGFQARTPRGWTAILPGTRLPVASGGATVFVPSRGELIAMLEAFGRPKDLVRAQRLRDLAGS